MSIWSQLSVSDLAKKCIINKRVEEDMEEEVAVDMAGMMSYSEVVSEYLTWI